MGGGVSQYDSLLARVRAESFGEDCVPWEGFVTPDGYGTVCLYVPGGPPKGIRLKVHRVVYEVLVGPIAEGLTIHHRCETKLCLNPLHLELVPRADHPRLHRKPLCPRGHRKDYLYAKTGQWMCSTCMRESTRRRRQRMKEERDGCSRTSP